MGGHAHPLLWWFDGELRLPRGRAHLTHRVKTLYGYEAICDLITDEGDRLQADDRLRYLMENPVPGDDLWTTFAAACWRVAPQPIL